MSNPSGNVVINNLVNNQNARYANPLNQNNNDLNNQKNIVNNQNIINDNKEKNNEGNNNIMTLNYNTERNIINDKKKKNFENIINYTRDVVIYDPKEDQEIKEEEVSCFKECICENKCQENCQSNIEYVDGEDCCEVSIKNFKRQYQKGISYLICLILLTIVLPPCGIIYLIFLWCRLCKKQNLD